MDINTHTLIIRADASPIMGSGHVMRCLALAEAWHDYGGNVTFVLAISSPPLEQRLLSESIEIQHITNDPGSDMDAFETVRIGEDRHAKWIVVDGYHFGEEYQKIIKSSGLSLLFIDDYGHANHYYSDIILNQNIYANISFYKKYEPYTTFLLGTKYVLLRREFLRWGGFNRTIPEIARKVLVTFGGSDSENYSLTVIEALKQINIDDLEVIVVVGSINKKSKPLIQAIKNHPNISIRKNVDNMPELMAWADVAISSGGTTCWELAFMGLPTILYPIAENQKLTVYNLISKGYMQSFETNEISNSKKCAKKIFNFLISYQDRKSGNEKMKELVDGDGTFRIVSQIFSPRIQLRYVKKTDCDSIYSWINDPFVRSNSFNSDIISQEEHERWFFSIISDKNTIYYIALDNLGNPIGQARFKIDREEAVISVLIEMNHRGKGLGSELIRCATKRCFDETKVTRIIAYIKINNNISLKNFLKAGYRQIGFFSKEGQDAYYLIKTRGEE